MRYRRDFSLKQNCERSQSLIGVAVKPTRFELGAKLRVSRGALA